MDFLIYVTVLLMTMCAWNLVTLGCGIKFVVFKFNGHWGVNTLSCHISFSR